MPQRCSIPGCGVGYKKGLKLLCYPKNPERRAAWIRSVESAGLVPTNTQFVCELHFGPEQWEKVRVDGTKKLKWSGVPNLLVRDDSAPNSFLQKPVNVQVELQTKASTHTPNILRKVVQLDCPCKNSKLDICVHLAQHPSVNTLKRKDENSADQTIGNDRNCSSICNVKTDSKKFSPIKIPARSLSPLLKASSQPAVIANLFQMNKEVPPLKASGKTLSAETVIPLKEYGHSVVVKVPASKYKSSLMEDLDDVKCFLNMTERTYEQRLVEAIAELVKKHQLMEEKLKKVDAAVLENLALKSQLSNYEEILRENNVLRNKLGKYEQAGSKRSLNSSDMALPPSKSKIETVAGTHGNCDKPFAQRVRPAIAVLKSPIPALEDDTNQFVALDDQL